MYLVSLATFKVFPVACGTYGWSHCKTIREFLSFTIIKFNRCYLGNVSSKNPPCLSLLFFALCLFFLWLS